jgi:hypothetical protein
LIAAFWLFDKLVRLEYELHPESWKDDGKLTGFFWLPPDADKSLTRFSCSLSWLFGTPEWMSNEPKALRMIIWYRILIVAWFLGLGGAFYLDTVLHH